MPGKITNGTYRVYLMAYIQGNPIRYLHATRNTLKEAQAVAESLNRGMTAAVYEVVQE